MAANADNIRPTRISKIEHLLIELASVELKLVARWSMESTVIMAGRILEAILLVC